MFIVLAKGRSLQGLEGARNVQEVSSRAGGERVFILRKELKKD